MDYSKLSAFTESLDRSLFIDNENRSFAYLDQPLPIGYGQTISQPSLVLEMTYLLSPGSTSSVLEIGTGSGYQTAILAQFSKHVYTMERIPELAQSARKRLEALGYNNITYYTGDGSDGWPEHAPFDRIIVTAAAGKTPVELLDQLSPGGIMIIPVGPPGMQELIQYTKSTKSVITSERIEYVRFVELTGKYGWQTGEEVK